MKRRYKTRRAIEKQALIQARAMPAVIGDLDYKITADADGDHFEVFTKHPFAAILVGRALADKLQTQTHVMLGSRVVASEEPRVRRRRI